MLDKELKLIPLTYDFAFKKVFCFNKELLKDFLISVLELEDIINPDECKIELEPNELPKENNKEYKKTIDINVILNNDIYVDIEVNREAFKDIKLRNMMYVDKLYSMILDKGEHYHKLDEKVMYQLNLNAIDKQITCGNDVVVPYGLETKKVYTDRKQIIVKYLEYYRILYYNKGTNKKSDIWLAALTSESFTELYDILSHILSAHERDNFIRNVIKMSKDGFSIHEWHKETFDAYIENKKMTRAKEEGIEQGIEQEKIEIAKNMLVMEIDIETISKVTGLSKSQIKNINAEL